MSGRLAVSLVALVCCAQSPDPTGLLERARTQIHDNVSRMSRYVCTRTIERELRHHDREPGSLTCAEIEAARDRGELLFKPAVRDRIRLDLVYVNGAEEHQWTGGGVVSKEHLEAIVLGGTLGTGDFSGFTAVIFTQPAAAIKFDRVIEVTGRRVYQYRYSVSREASHYGVGSLDDTYTVAYAGTFQLDTANADLVRLTVKAGRIPAESKMCSADMTIDLARTAIRGVEVMLPRLTTLDTVLGYFATSNRTQYSQCREFSAHSEISYFEAGEPAGATAPKGDAIAGCGSPSRSTRPRVPPAISSRQPSSATARPSCAAGSCGWRRF